MADPFCANISSQPMPLSPLQHQPELLLPPSAFFSTFHISKTERGEENSIAAVFFIKLESLSASSAFVELKDWRADTRVGKTNPIIRKRQLKKTPPPPKSTKPLVSRSCILGSRVYPELSQQGKLCTARNPCSLSICIVIVSDTFSTG